MENEVVQILGLSPFALKIISFLITIITLIIGWAGYWLKKNFDSILNAKKELSDIELAFKEYKLKLDREIMQTKLDRKNEYEELKNQINTKLQQSIKRIWDRIDENRGMLSGVIDRISKSMDRYDDRVFNLERRIEKKLITRDEYNRELSAIKDIFFRELVSFQKDLHKVDPSDEFHRKNKNSDIENMIKSIIEINQKIINSENKISKIDNQVSLQDKKIKQQRDIIKSNESKNIEIHRVTKNIISKAVNENKEVNANTNKSTTEAINGFKNKIIAKIEEIAARGSKKQDIGDNKVKTFGEKTKLDTSQNLGKIIKKD